MRSMLLCGAVMLAAVPANADAARPQRPGAEPQAANQTQGASSIAAIVDAEFPAYDANGNDQLEPQEFVKWMIALKEQEMKATGKIIPATEISGWAGGAFTSADADGSGAVSKEELMKYLTNGGN